MFLLLVPSGDTFLQFQNIFLHTRYAWIDIYSQSQSRKNLTCDRIRHALHSVCNDVSRVPWQWKDILHIIIGIKTLCTKYKLMIFQTTLPSEYTYHTNMDAVHDICVDDPSDDSSNWMIYYAHHRIWTVLTIYALMVLQITHLTKWFITHITGIWILSTMYALM
jgi:hypothetical protein